MTPIFFSIPERKNSSVAFRTDFAMMRG